MRVITAPELIITNLPTVFLAGGITDCPWWQDTLAELLAKDESAVLLNPRRRDFPINDSSAAEEQITWEYHALNSATIFSMWFSAGPSVQPICMYELGRHLARLEKEPYRIVIGIEPGYLCEQDVRIQTGLVDPGLETRISVSLEGHAQAIDSALFSSCPSCGAPSAVPKT